MATNQKSVSIRATKQTYVFLLNVQTITDLKTLRKHIGKSQARSAPGNSFGHEFVSCLWVFSFSKGVFNEFPDSIPILDISAFVAQLQGSASGMSHDSFQ